MKVSYVEVKELFGLYNHKINMNLNNDITIIHAPNGYGKTTILKLIKYTIDGDFYNLDAIPFKEFEIRFTDSNRIKVIKNNYKDTYRNNQKLRNSNTHMQKNLEFPIIYEITKPGSNPKQYKPKLNFESNFPLISMIENELPNLRRVAPKVWRDINTGEHLTLSTVMQRYSNILPLDDERNDLNEDLKFIKSSIPVNIIRSDRLLRLRTPDAEMRYRTNDNDNLNYESSVTIYSLELIKSIESLLAQSAALSQDFDRTFPYRLLNKMINATGEEIMDEITIGEKLLELEEKRIRLESVGLLDASTPAPVLTAKQHMDEQTRKVLSLYIEDTEKKLNIFDDMEKRINLMKQIINGKNKFQNKELKVTRKDGFIFELPDKSILTPEKLSSGEQHEVVLNYELLFKSDSNSLVLIDEPEISLHLLWQQQYLDDMLQITNLTKSQMLIATHSPDIIHNHWDFTVPLEG